MEGNGAGREEGSGCVFHWHNEKTYASGERRASLGKRLAAADVGLVETRWSCRDVSSSRCISSSSSRGSIRGALE